MYSLFWVYTDLLGAEVSRTCFLVFQWVWQTHQLLFAHGQAFLVELRQIALLKFSLQLGLCSCNKIPGEHTYLTLSEKPVYVSSIFILLYVLSYTYILDSKFNKWKEVVSNIFLKEWCKAHCNYLASMEKSLSAILSVGSAAGSDFLWSSAALFTPSSCSTPTR